MQSTLAEGKRAGLAISMRRFIRSKKTGAFWKEGVWIHDPREAQHFPTVYELMFTSEKHQLRDIEMVLRAEAGSCGEIVLGVPEQPANGR